MNVPKFTSFRPKPSLPNPNYEAESRDKRTARDLERPDRRHRSRSKDRGDYVPKKSHATQRVETASDFFVVDREGDVKNLVYGGISRYDVPRYHRVGAGSVLGIASNIKIQKEQSDDKGIMVANGHIIKRGRLEKYVFSKMGKPRLLEVQSRPESDPQELAKSDFLPLESHGRDHKTIGSNMSVKSDSEDELQHYRSIQGKATPTEPANSAPQNGSKSQYSDSEDAIIESAVVRQKQMELNRKVDESPSDIEAWLALIEHQDVVLSGGHGSRRITSAEIQSTAEIKIHMYEKALEKVKPLLQRERLLKGLMAEGAKIWEVQYQSQKWEQIAADNIESAALWKNYLDFKQATFTTFSFEEIRELYKRRFRLLSEEINEGTEPKSLSLSQQLIYVLLRYTGFLISCGFTELAIAIWQANLELNLRSPPSCKDWKSDFQEFWESEVSRIGEERSLGWSAFKKNPEEAMQAISRVDQVVGKIDKSGICASWVRAEREIHKASRLPARTMDETLEDDPFRVILHSDIEDFLFMFSSSLENVNQYLLDGLLLFCRLPALTRDQPAWLSDPLIEGDALDADNLWIETYFSLRSSDDTERPVSSALKTPFHDYSSATENLFSQHWHQRFEGWDKIYGDKISGVIPYEWVRNVLLQLLDSHFSESLAERFIAFEWQNDPQMIKKTAKSLLKKHSSSLRLYNAYSMIEWARGNKDAAAAVFTAAISMSSSKPENEMLESSLLWKSWVWCCLESGDLTSALALLLSLPERVPDTSVKSSPTAVIRAKQYLTSNRDYLLSNKFTGAAMNYGELLALLEYLTTSSTTEPQSSAQGNIASFLTTIDSISATLASRDLSNSHYHEILLQSSTRLFYNHVRFGPFRPGLFRSTLQSYLDIFPSNTIFLSLFTWNESRFRIENRVRTFLISQQNPTLSQHLFRIRYELQSGNVHRARSAFENAVTPVTSVARSNPSIWKLYILFTAEHFKEKTKEVWYGALRACPWVKELYLVGFEILGETLDMAELKGTWRVLGEKGLRVHIDLEEAFDEIE